MKPSQFTLKRALLTTAMIAVGCLGVSMVMRWDDLSGPGKFFAGTLFWTSPILICAGVGKLFNLPHLGAAIGVLLTVMLFILLSFLAARSIHT